MRAKRILLIEENRKLARFLCVKLEDEGYEVHSVSINRRGLLGKVDDDCDLIVLDVSLLEAGGWKIFRTLGAEALYAYTPVFLLGNQVTASERAMALELGADDYLAKPLSVREFLARVRAILRRIEAIEAKSRIPHDKLIHHGDLLIDVSKHEVSVGRTPITLTSREFQLLLKLVAAPGRVFTRRQLLDTVWGYDFEGYDHTVNSHINRLRKKLEPRPDEPRFILTVRGVGYKFSEQRDPNSRSLPAGKSGATQLFSREVGQLRTEASLNA